MHEGRKNVCVCAVAFLPRSSSLFPTSSSILPHFFLALCGVGFANKDNSFVCLSCWPQRANPTSAFSNPQIPESL